MSSVATKPVAPAMMSFIAFELLMGWGFEYIWEKGTSIFEP